MYRCLFVMCHASWTLSVVFQIMLKVHIDRCYHIRKEMLHNMPTFLGSLSRTSPILIWGPGPCRGSNTQRLWRFTIIKENIEPSCSTHISDALMSSMVSECGHIYLQVPFLPLYKLLVLIMLLFQHRQLSARSEESRWNNILRDLTNEPKFSCGISSNPRIR